MYTAVWTEEVENYKNSVMWCISQLRKKLEPDPDKLQYTHTVKGVGYKFEYRSEEYIFWAFSYPIITEDFSLKVG